MTCKAFARAGFVVLLFAAAGCGQNDSGDREDIDTALKSFEGEWIVTSLIRGGKASPAESLPDISVKVEKDRFTMVEVKGQSRRDDHGVSVRSAFTEVYVLQVPPGGPSGATGTRDLSPAKPGALDRAVAAPIDFVYSRGDHLGQTRYGIYILDGNKLKFCLGVVGHPRPTDFTPTSKTTLLTLDRKP